MTDFVHLHCHSEYSIKNSTIRLKSLISQAKLLDFKALALTDEFNLFCAVKFYQQATQANIKPIFGTEITILEGENRYQAILLCQDNQGYKNLSELISQCYFHHQILGEVLAPIDLIKQYNQGLIMIAPAIQSDIAQLLLNNQITQAQEKLTFWQAIFPNRYYLAIQRTQRAHDEQHLQLTVLLALKTNTPIVATNAVQFIVQEDFEAHEVKVCISQGELVDDDRRIRLYSQEQYLKSPKQMCELFDDLPEAINNSEQIAKRCNVKFELFKKNYLPEFPTPSSINVADFFIQESKQGLDKKIKHLTLDNALYQKRLMREIKVILKMNFPGYFLIVADFIRYAKEQGIPVGPGRGSGAGSLVAYALDITNVDPIYHDLLFERFLNPDRVSMPDFDIDFCADRRDEIIAYVARKYGTEKVSQIITYGTMAAKGVVRDVGRVLGHPYGFSDTLAKLIPNKLKITLARTMGQFSDKDKPEDRKKFYSPDFVARYQRDESVTNLIDIAKTLEGLSRNVGTHAGGVVIAPSKISHFCPIYKGVNDKDNIISQFDKDDLEAVGLVKFDFLGLSNLTVIDGTINSLQKQKITKKRLDLNTLPLDDELVYQLLQAGETTGIFQLESNGMRTYLQSLKPDSFSDIVAMLALYRPGPLESGMVEEYIEVKHGKKIQYPHPMLETVLKPTNGVFLYQEQVMKAAQVMAGYTLAEADILRRVMGKKKEEEMRNQRSIFVSGSIKKGVNENQANKIFDLIDKFSGYGFNKSHSVAYALVSYQTAYLKSHYPLFFMASVLSGMMGDTDKIAFVITEVKRMGLKIDAPNVNLSYFPFVVNDHKIVYGLGAIKGVGQALVEQISVEREQNGTYKDLVDFCCRIDKHLLNKRALEALVLSGSFDQMSENRHELFNTFPKAVCQAEQYQRDKISGQGGLFNDPMNQLDYQDIIVPSKKWSPKKTLIQEKTVMGFFFSAHPSQFYTKQLKQLSAKLPSQIKMRARSQVRLLGMISDLRFQDSSKGRIALLEITDHKMNLFVVTSAEATQKIEAIIEPSERLKDDDMIMVTGTIAQNFKKDKWHIRAETINKVERALFLQIKNIIILLNQQQQTKFQALADILLNHQGNCPVYLQYSTTVTTGVIPLSKQYYVKPSDLLKIQLITLLGQKNIAFN